MPDGGVDVASGSGRSQGGQRRRGGGGWPARMRRLEAENRGMARQIEALKAALRKAGADADVKAEGGEPVLGQSERLDLALSRAPRAKIQGDAAYYRADGVLNVKRVVWDTVQGLCTSLRLTPTLLGRAPQAFLEERVKSIWPVLAHSGLGRFVAKFERPGVLDLHRVHIAQVVQMCDTLDAVMRPLPKDIRGVLGIEQE